MNRFISSWCLAGRNVLTAPTFAATVVLTLAVAIGANTVVYSIIDRVLLRPMPFPEPDRLVYVTHANEASSLQAGIPPIRLLDWSERNASFEAVSGYFTASVTDTTGERPELVSSATVGRGFLDVWGIEPALGRNFVAEEHRVGGPAGILISDRYWRERLNARDDVIGRTLIIDGRPVTVVGVMPPEFVLVDADVDLWVPLAVDAPFTTSRETGFFGGVVGRLRPGISLEQAQLDLQTVQSRLARDYPETDSDLNVSVVRYRDTVVGPFRSSLWILFSAVSVLVLIACCNIAALLLARTAQRDREIAIRTTLGATRTDIAMQLLAETAVLVIAGTAGALLFAYGAESVLERYTAELPTFGGIAVDSRIVVYTLACTLIVVLLCGLFPAVRAARSAGLRSRAGRGDVSPRQRANWSLVGIQVALSVTLLTGAGLLLRSFDSLARLEPGFETDHVLTFTVHGNFGETADPAGVVQRINRTLDELEVLPGVEATATSISMPGSSVTAQEPFRMVDWTPPADVPVIAESLIVSPSYFDTLQIPLLTGELCRRPNSPADPPEVMVNRAFVDRYFGSRPAVGRTLASAGRRIGEVAASPARIVGVVGNAREKGLHLEAPPAVYACYSAPSPVPLFLVRVRGDPMAAVESVRARLAELEPLRPVYRFAALGRSIGDKYTQDRMRTVLLTLFSAAALSLSCLGVYGTLSYIVSLRQREVGLRLALGALRNRIVMFFVAKALKVAGIACVVGLTLSLVFARSLSGMLYGVSPFDPLTFACVITVVVLVAALAALVPAMHASRMDPMAALRDE